MSTPFTPSPRNAASAVAAGPATKPGAAAPTPEEPPRRLRVDHETRYDYEDDVEIAHHLAHLRPRCTPWQRVRNWRLEVDPVPDDAPTEPDPAPTSAVPDSDCVDVPPGVRLSTDCWRNWRACFSHARVHERLIVRSVFLAELAPRPAPDIAASPAWERVARSLDYRPGTPFEPAAEFALPTRLAPRHASLERLAREVFTARRPLAEAAHALMLRVHESFAYRPASTSVSTSAIESLAQRQGVCQDFAHVMIGAMRSIGLAARYVSGYLLTRPPPGQPRLVGADATHAWIEAWCPVNGWIALDPTNGVHAGQDHVTVAWGRDYADVAPLRGVIRGGGRVQPRVAVTVEPVEEPAQAG
ncbi:MAG: hypothetical protein RIS35_668 [Pseudomonadota bacterium]